MLLKKKHDLFKKLTSAFSIAMPLGGAKSNKVTGKFSEICSTDAPASKKLQSTMGGQLWQLYD